jgi:hypothetical protein
MRKPKSNPLGATPISDGPDLYAPPGFALNTLMSRWESTSRNHASLGGCHPALANSERIASAHRIGIRGRSIPPKTCWSTSAAHHWHRGNARSAS